VFFPFFSILSFDIDLFKLLISKHTHTQTHTQAEKTTPTTMGVCESVSKHEVAATCSQQQLRRDKLSPPPIVHHTKCFTREQPQPLQKRTLHTQPIKSAQSQIVTNISRTDQTSATTSRAAEKTFSSPNNNLCQYTLTDSELDVDPTDDTPVAQPLESILLQQASGMIRVQLSTVNDHADSRICEIETAYKAFKEIVQEAYINQRNTRFSNEYAIQEADFQKCQSAGEDIVYLCKDFIQYYSVATRNYNRMFFGRDELVDAHVYRRSTTEEELKMLDRVAQICAEVEQECSGHFWGLFYAHKHSSAEASHFNDTTNDTYSACDAHA
jgi:hypothetical protein